MMDFGKAVLLANLFNKKTPVNVMWRITNRCNSRCKYCDIPLRKQKEPTTKQILNLIDQMKQAGTQRIGFVGGEPLVREDMEQIVEYCKQKGAYTTLVTNGYMVPDRISLLKKLDHLIISFDGQKEAHEHNREKGAFYKVYRALKIAPKQTDKMLLFWGWSITKLGLCIKGKGITIYGRLGLSYVNKVCEGWRCRGGMSFQ